MKMLSPSLSVTRSLVSLLLLFLLPLIACQQYEGNDCKVNESSGICTRLQQCASVYKDLLAGKSPSKVCGFSGFEPVVCCPKSGNQPTTPPPTRRTPAISRPTTSTTTEVAPLIGGERGAVAKAKCAEYAKAVYSLEIPPTLSAGNRQPTNISLCAIKTRKLIVGGTKADPKEFPHMAAVGYNGRENGILWLCGGTLISDRFVLSAAHCMESADWGAPTKVRLGDLNLVRDDDGAKPRVFDISERIKFPGYKRPLEYHDIALLKLNSKVHFNAWIRPACLPYSLPDIGTDNKAVATGWGRVDWADDEGSNDLLKVTLNIVQQPRCNKSFGQNDYKLKFGIVNQIQICAGELGKDTCQGDSGGPLVILNNDTNCMYSLIGITSLGRLCGSIIPGVYTRVYHYIPWIENVVWPDAS